MKANSSIYKGIKYVQVSALPSDQKEKLLQTINPELLIKILVDGILVGNCLQYKDYEFWFENTFMTQVPKPKPQRDATDVVATPVVSNQQTF